MKTALIVAASVTTVGAVAAAATVVGVKHHRSKQSVDESVASALKGNEKLFRKKELALIKALLARDQAHLFAAWPAPGTQDDLKRKLVAQLVALDGSYHGGLCAYIDNAKKLLQDSKEGRNPFEGYTPSVPHGEKLDFGSSDFKTLEEEGLAQAGSTAFVLVAGGLGERLGYSGIKVALPCESATGMCFMELYARYIKALQVASGTSKQLPFAIMTSDDTHARTQHLLEQHNYFGLAKSQVHLMKQEKVACLIDNNAALALDPADSYAIQTKPHGHGDVHALLHSTGLAKKWHKQGFKWVAFFQDTNALVVRALAAALGVSARHDYDMNSLAVPRKAKEAIGAIASLKHRDGGTLTINVEYNQLDPLLRETTNPQGDVNDETGWSPFPGNINQLILKLDSYAEQLHRTGGIISEFVNPKYKDASKTAFKSSTRLECMMQDYPKALPPTAKVGFTTINQVWASYSPVKNNPADALAKSKEGNPTHSATTGELDIYRTNAVVLQQVAGAAVGDARRVTFNGIPCDMGPAVVLSPEFAPTLSAVAAKVKAGSVALLQGAALVLDGPDITIDGPVKVDGALVIKAVPGARVRVGALPVSNKGWRWEPLPEGAAGQNAPEEERIRGFHVVKVETAEYIFDKPGDYTVGDTTPATPANSTVAAPPTTAAASSSSSSAAPAPPAAPAAAPPTAPPATEAAPLFARPAGEPPQATNTPVELSKEIGSATGGTPATPPAEPVNAASEPTPAAEDAPLFARPAEAAPAAAGSEQAAGASGAAASGVAKEPTVAALISDAAAPSPALSGTEDNGDEDEDEDEATAAAPAAGASTGAKKKKKKIKKKKAAAVA